LRWTTRPLNFGQECLLMSFLASDLLQEPETSGSCFFNSRD
jgi:hypothetical protein